MRAGNATFTILMIAWSGTMLADTSIVGPFSGVGLQNLTDTPMLVRKTLFQCEGKQLLSLGKGMKLQGEAVVTQKSFSIEINVETPGVGEYALAVRASAPNRGADSYWVFVDGKRIKRPLTPPVGVMGERSIALGIDKPGKHRLRLTLRERPGSVISRLHVYKLSNRIPLPPMRKALLGKHPRMFFTAEDLEGMRKRLTDKRVRRFYSPPGPLRRKPKQFRPGKRNGGSYRSLGNYALSYLLKPDEKKLKPILRWLEVATTYPHCGVDLDAEYFLEGVALTYDWLYEHIPPGLRARVRDTIARQCRQVYKASLHGRAGGGLSFQQNHYWYAHLSLALGAAAVYGEVPEADAWLAWAWDRFERIALSFSPDGGYHEGPGYWDFSMPTLYMYTDLYEWCTGLHVPYADAGLHGQAQFRFHHLYPGFEFSAALEDSKTTLHRPPVKLLLWEAKRFRDPVTMGMAKLLSRGPYSIAWRLLWLDEDIEARDPLQTLPLAKYYPDVEMAFARTSWDKDATFIAFVSRPLGGHKWADLCAKFGLGGTGHNHPEQNHFVLFGQGEVLAADPGYTYEKKTRNHNTILVDGKGQYGDGEVWPRPNPGRAHITQFVADGDVTIMSGDAASAYPAELGLLRFDRTIVLAGRDLVVVCDRLAAKQPTTFSWLLHHYGHLSKAEGAWTITRGRAQLRVQPIVPAGLQVQTTVYRPQYIHPKRNLTPKEADIKLLEFKAGPVRETTFLVPLLIGPAGSKPPAVYNISTDTALTVRVGQTVVAFNSGKGEMRVPMPWGEAFRTSAQAVVARLHEGKRQIVAAPVH